MRECVAETDLLPGTYWLSTDRRPASFAGLATYLRRQRQMDGIATAKAAGSTGTEPTIEVGPLKKLRQDGLGPTIIAR